MTAKSSSEIMREYSKLIEENEVDQNEISNEPTSNTGEIEPDSSDNPADALAAAIAAKTGCAEADIVDAVGTYLADNNLEIVSAIGLEDEFRNV